GGQVGSYCVFDALQRVVGEVRVHETRAVAGSHGPAVRVDLKAADAVTQLPFHAAFLIGKQESVVGRGHGVVRSGKCDLAEAAGAVLDAPVTHFESWAGLRTADDQVDAEADYEQDPERRRHADGPASTTVHRHGCTLGGRDEDVEQVHERGVDHERAE